MIVLLVAIAVVLFGAAVLAAVADRLDRRPSRRAIGRAHQPRPFDWEREPRDYGGSL